MFQNDNPYKTYRFFWSCSEI